MDISDQASQIEELLVNYEIQKIRANAQSRLKHNGYCYYCEDDVPNPNLFCDSVCHKDYEYVQSMKKISGEE